MNLTQHFEKALETRFLGGGKVVHIFEKVELTDVGTEQTAIADIKVCVIYNNSNGEENYFVYDGDMLELMKVLSE